jgi:hypothetical protein
MKCDIDSRQMLGRKLLLPSEQPRRKGSVRRRRKCGLRRNL